MPAVLGPTLVKFRSSSDQIQKRCPTFFGGGGGGGGGFGQRPTTVIVSGSWAAHVKIRINGTLNPLNYCVIFIGMYEI
jgi:hypothetical protein